MCGYGDFLIINILGEKLLFREFQHTFKNNRPWDLFKLKIKTSFPVLNLSLPGVIIKCYHHLLYFKHYTCIICIASCVHTVCAIANQ